MPRAFLVLNKKSKAKQKRCDSDSVDNNTSVNDCLDVKDFADGLIKEIRNNHDIVVGGREEIQESEDEEGEIDVGGPSCSGRDQWAFSHREGDRDSVSSISPPARPESFPAEQSSVKVEDNLRSSSERTNGFKCHNLESRASDLEKGKKGKIYILIATMRWNHKLRETFVVKLFETGG